MNRMLGRIGGIVFSIIFVAAGIFTLVMGVRRMMDLNAAVPYPMKLLLV
jgi:hypothetical protein